IKLAFGACMPEKLQSLSEKIIQINDEENGSYEQLPVKYLSEIITCRVREIIEAVLWQIQDSGYADKLRNGIVLTGGGANLVNLANLLKEISGYTVRIGYPRSQAFSAIGCSGTGETGAVASIGMILEAKRDPRLNCLDEAPHPSAAAGDGTAQEGQDAAPAPETLFPEEPGEVITPRKQKAEKKPNKFVSWIRQKSHQVGEAAEGAFDSTMGSLFDEMK
ncbi:MAG: rod shape-determining protein, partial [Bacteroidales bacterium]|nr:rod shape-determining protein [Bacteroidales bacterium]